MMFTDSSRPTCIKCDNQALMLVHDMWVCGECYHKFLEKQTKLKQEIFLKE